MIDQTELDRLTALAAAATPGPWATPPTNPSVYRWSQGSSDNVGSVHIAECGNMKDKELRPFNADRWRADAAFIAAARAAIPALIAGIERLNTALFSQSDISSADLSAERMKVENLEAEVERLTRERDEARENAETFRQSQYALETQVIALTRERDQECEIALAQKREVMRWMEAHSAVCDERDAALAQRDRLREALEWYGENARLCRLIHSGGDAGRHALSADGGNRALAALSEDKS